jgi:chitinase
MKRTLAAVTLLALVTAQMPTLYAGTGSSGVIMGTMRGPGGPVAGVRVNALDTKGTIIGTAVTNGTGSYSLEGLPAGTFVVQAVSATGHVMTTSRATLSSAAMKSTANLTASAAAAPAAQAAAVKSSGFNTQSIWWIVGASAATAGVVGAVVLHDDASPSN